MMNKSLARSTTEFLLFVFACGITVGISPLDSLATPMQAPRFNETPDPYFNQKKIQKAPSGSEANDFNSDFVAPQTTPGLKPNQTPPTVVPNTQPSASESTQPDIWNAPLTPARAGNQPVKSPSGFSAPSGANSIIREKKQPFKLPTDFGLKSLDANQSTNQTGKPSVPATKTKVPQSNDFQPNVSANSTQRNSKPDDLGHKTKGLFGENLKTGDKPSESSANDFGGGGFPTKIAERDSSKIAPPTKPSAQKSKAKPTDSGPKDAAEPFAPSKVIALVGGEPIFVGDLLFEVNQIIEQFMPNAPDELKEQERQKMIPKMLPKFVEQKILFMGSIRMLPEEADIEAVLEQAGKEFDDKALEKIMENSGIKSIAEFDAHLRVQGSSLRHLRRTWSIDQLTKYFLSQQMKVETEVTHQEMLDTYRKNHDSYAIPARSKWEQVMIRFDRSKSRAEAKQTMVELGNQIVYGANLPAVAKKSSHGFMSDEGGQHDWTSRGALVLKEIDEAIFTLPIGELSDIIMTRDGYHVVRVIERTEATHKPFLEAQVEIKEKILADKRLEAYQEHLAKLKEEIPVEYYLNEEAESAIGSASPRTAQR